MIILCALLGLLFAILVTTITFLYGLTIQLFILYMDRLRTIVTEVYKAINGMSPEFLQDLFLLKANVHDLRDNKMKL